MAKDRSETVNTGGASEPTAEERERAFRIAGNVEEKGEDPSPDDRERGEVSSKEPEAPVDLDR